MSLGRDIREIDEGDDCTGSTVWNCLQARPQRSAQPFAETWVLNHPRRRCDEPGGFRNAGAEHDEYVRVETT